MGEGVAVGAGTRVGGIWRTPLVGAGSVVGVAVAATVGVDSGVAVGRGREVGGMIRDPLVGAGVIPGGAVGDPPTSGVAAPGSAGVAGVATTDSAVAIAGVGEPVFGVEG